MFFYIEKSRNAKALRLFVILDDYYNSPLFFQFTRIIHCYTNVITIAIL